jgi:hypothetical protein
MKASRLVETVIGQLSKRFHIEKGAGAWSLAFGKSTFAFWMH